MSIVPIEPEVAGDPSVQAPPITVQSRNASGQLFRFAMISLILFIIAATLRMAAPGIFDRPITMTINGLARRSPLLDYALHALDEYPLFQGVPVLGLAFGAMAVTRDKCARVALVLGCASAALAALSSRALQLALPHLPRPLFDPALSFRPPYGADVLAMKDWSSFPSDHAALLGGVAAATLITNRRIGALAVAVATASFFVRIYGGLHYADDILGGALLGAAVVCASTAIVRPHASAMARLADGRPALVATLLFIAASQAAYLFNDLRSIAQQTAHHLTEMRMRASTTQLDSESLPPPPPERDAHLRRCP